MSAAINNMPLIQFIHLFSTKL